MNNTFMTLYGRPIHQAVATSAGTGVLIYLADEDELRDLTFWTLGSFGGASWSDVQLATFTVLLPSIFALFLSKTLNVMLLGAVSLVITQR